MEALLTDLYLNSSIPFYSAILLGLLIAIAPCPLTINITAIGYIGKDIGSRKRILLNGFFYALGTVFSYSVLAIILYLGADQFKISSLFQQYSEKIVGPILLMTGLFMLGVISLKFPGLSKLTHRFLDRLRYSYFDAFLLGVVLALAFCPYSGALYFGMLIPLTITAEAPWLPLIFSIVSAIPIVAFAWLLAYAVSGIGRAYNRIKSFERWFRRIVALLFIGIGLYTIIIAWF
jgi:cytochrome c-type biogenesis protein